MNPYEKAIFEVGSVLEPYTIDGLFHLMGFGGQPLYMKNPAENLQTSYCWNLNGAPYEDILGGKVKNTAGMLTSYHHAVMQTKMTGPSYFQKIIERFMEIVKCEVKIYPQLYFIFVIVTDGCIHDMDYAKSLFIRMSKYPISVIIVGLGDEKFEEMKVLDADTEVLQDDFGNKAARDIVQFVKFDDMSELAKVEVEENLL